LKRLNTAYIMSAIGIFLLLSVIIAGNGVFKTTETLNGMISMQKISVCAKNQLDPQGSNLFTAKDMDRIQETLNNRMITYTIQTTLPVSFENASISARVIGTNSFYSMFHDVSIKSGGFLTQESQDRGETVAVIEDELAWKLFNTDNAVGNQISIFDRTFKIIGVCSKEHSIIAKLYDDGNANIYIPSKTFSDLDKNAGISCFEAATDDDSTLGRNESEITRAIQTTGKNPSAYKITDYNIQRALMEQKPSIVVFLMGIITILGLLLYIKTVFIHLISFFKSESSTNYFSNIVRRNALFLLLSAGKAVLALLFVFFLWQCIRFKLYINPVYVPDELIDVSYYFSLLKDYLQQNAIDKGYIAPYSEQLLQNARVLSDIIFYAGFLPGLFFLATGLSLFRKCGLEADRIFLLQGILLLISSGALLSLSIVSGLHAAMDLKSFAVLCPFLLAGCLGGGFAQTGRTGKTNQIS
jgi:hypothetical protein